MFLYINKARSCNKVILPNKLVLTYKWYVLKVQEKKGDSYLIFYSNYEIQFLADILLESIT